MKKIFFVAAALLLGAMASCQPPAPGRQLSLKIEYQDLYSTHRDHFRGISVGVSKPVSSAIALGIGMELSGNNYHFDNDWNLYHLRFLPLYFEQELRSKSNGRLYPVLHIAEGLTYASYQKETLANPGRRQTIHEAGLYLYGGAGLRGNLSRNMSLSAEAGIKGFHNSFNDLDVNPHGFTGRLGLIYRGAD